MVHEGEPAWKQFWSAPQPCHTDATVDSGKPLRLSPHVCWSHQKLSQSIGASVSFWLLQVDIEAEVDGWLHCVNQYGVKGLIPATYIRILGANEGAADVAQQLFGGYKASKVSKLAYILPPEVRSCSLAFSVARLKRNKGMQADLMMYLKYTSLARWQ